MYTDGALPVPLLYPGKTLRTLPADNNPLCFPLFKCHCFQETRGFLICVYTPTHSRSYLCRCKVNGSSPRVNACGLRLSKDTSPWRPFLSCIQKQYTSPVSFYLISCHTNTSFLFVSYPLLSFSTIRINTPPYYHPQLSSILHFFPLPFPPLCPATSQPHYLMFPILQQSPTNLIASSLSSFCS